MRAEAELDVRATIDRVTKRYFVPRGAPLPLCEFEQHWLRRRDETPAAHAFIGMAWFESAERADVAPWARFLVDTPELQVTPTWHRPSTLAGEWVEAGLHGLGRRWSLELDGVVRGGPMVAKVALWSEHARRQIVYRSRAGAIQRRLDYRLDAGRLIVTCSPGRTSTWTRRERSVSTR